MREEVRSSRTVRPLRWCCKGVSFRGRGGGPAGGGGFNFQARATALVYAHVLAGSPLNFAVGHYPVPLAVSAETDGPGDDVHVECEGGAVVEIQAKRGLRADRRLWDAAVKMISGLARASHTPAPHPAEG